MQSNKTVFVVTGEHPVIPGVAQSVHATRAGADTRAAELVNHILSYMTGERDEGEVDPWAVPATPEDWAERLDQAIYSDSFDDHDWSLDDVYVCIQEMEIQDEPGLCGH